MEPVRQKELHNSAGRFWTFRDLAWHSSAACVALPGQRTSNPRACAECTKRLRDLLAESKPAGTSGLQSLEALEGIKFWELRAS